MAIRQVLKTLNQTPLFKDNLWTVDIIATGAGSELQQLALLAQRVTIPEAEIEYEYDSIRKRSYPVSYTDPQEMTISFIETEDMRITNLLNLFEEDILLKDNQGFTTGAFRNDTEGFTKKTIIVNFERFKPLGQNISSRLIEFANFGGVGVSNLFQSDFLETVATYTFTGARLKSRSNFELQYETNNLTIIEAVFSFDQMKKDIKNVSGKGLLGL